MKKKQIKSKQQKNSIALKKSDLKHISSKDNQAEMIVKVISVFEYIGAAFCIFFGLVLLFGGQLFLAMIPAADISQIPAAVLSVALTVLAVVMIIFGIVAVFFARALWNLKNWARILFVIFSSIGALMALMSLPSGILGLILHGAIVYFLGFDKNVTALFK